MTKADEQPVAPANVEPVEGDDAGCVEFELEHDPGTECRTQDCPRVATRSGLCEAHWASRRGDMDREVAR